MILIVGGYAGSGLPQGLFLGNNLFPLHFKSGFKMGFCQWAGMGPKVSQKWVFGCKSG